MNDALVMGRYGQGSWFIHSDHVAARMMQKAIAQGDGPAAIKKTDGAMELRMDRAEARDARRADRIEAREERRAERIEAREERRAERIEAREGLREVEGPREIEKLAPISEIGKVTEVSLPATPIFGDGQKDALAALREKVGEMSRALESLTKAMDAMGDFKLLVAEGDSASVVAFAGQVLAEMRNDAEAKLATDDSEAAEIEDAVEPAAATDADGDVEVVEPGMAETDGDAEAGRYTDTDTEGSGNDSFNLTGDTISDVHGGDGDDAITAMATLAAKNIYGGSGDDTITVTGKDISGIYGGSGNDRITVSGQQSDDMIGGDGDDRMDITAPIVGMVDAGRGNDQVKITARDVAMIEAGEGNDSFDLQVARANLRLTEAMGNDVVGLRDAAHIEILVAEHEAMLRDGMASIWQGDNLVLEFSGGGRLKLENAANAGSLTLRAGDEVINLKPEMPMAEAFQMLDVIL